jgi:L-ascorbate metabolism protein UlaG (beta-lactamase superfamily)
LVAAVVLLAAGCPRAGTGGGAPPTAPPTSVAPTSPKAAPAGAGGGETKPMGPGVKVRYYGQSCFLVTDSTGKRVATDPYGDGVGYPPLSLAADVCLVSHDHFDHNNTKAVSGSPEVLRTAGAHEARGLPCLGVTALHHEAGEHSERGTVVMFRWVMDGVALLHVGDLATSLDAEQLKALGNVDVLLLPVGGYYTIDAQKALGVARSLKAKVVIPMH